jgi:hypothetical protein
MLMQITNDQSPPTNHTKNAGTLNSRPMASPG